MSQNKTPKKPLPETAEKALKEAEQRRNNPTHATASAPKELQGRKGPDPARYGDWENKGIASDF